MSPLAKLQMSILPVSRTPNFGHFCLQLRLPQKFGVKTSCPAKTKDGLEGGKPAFGMGLISVGGFFN